MRRIGQLDRRGQAINPRRQDEQPRRAIAEPLGNGRFVQDLQIGQPRQVRLIPQFDHFLDDGVQRQPHDPRRRGRPLDKLQQGARLVAKFVGGLMKPRGEEPEFIVLDLESSVSLVNPPFAKQDDLLPGRERLARHGPFFERITIVAQHHLSRVT